MSVKRESGNLWIISWEELLGKIIAQHPGLTSQLFSLAQVPGLVSSYQASLMAVSDFAVPWTL